jgi:hypothetical protein
LIHPGQLGGLITVEWGAACTGPPLPGSLQRVRGAIVANYQNRTAWRAAMLAEQLQLSAAAIEAGEGTEFEHEVVTRLWAELFKCEPEHVVAVVVVKALAQAAWAIEPDLSKLTDEERVLIGNNRSTVQSMAQAVREEIRTALPLDVRLPSLDAITAALGAFRGDKWGAALTLLKRIGCFENIEDGESFKRSMMRRRWKEIVG